MMSARTDLIAALTSALPSDTYTVSPKPPTPKARITKRRGHVTVQRAGITPATGTTSWGHALTVSLCVGADEYDTAEDTLDTLLPDVVAAVEAIDHHAVVSIDRDVLFETGDAPGFHGYRITTATITPNI